MVRYFVFALVLGWSALLVVSGCSDDKAGAACARDSDCRGARVCISGVCEAPDGNTNSGTGRGEDTGVEDSGGSGGEDTNVEDSGTVQDDTNVVEPDTTDLPDIGDPPSSVCVEALEYVEGCEELVFNDGQYNLNWPVCDSERDVCAAECLLRQSCGALGCDFNPDIDCDAPGPVWDCLQDECADPDPPCDTCTLTFNCCSGWICHDEDNPPDICDIDCFPTDEPPPDCGCNDDGVCTATPNHVSVCEQAVGRLFSCGFDLEDLRENHPRDHAQIAQLIDGDCTNPYLRCYAGCMAFPEEDQCFSCHLTEQICMRNFFSECIDTCEQPAVTPEQQTALCIDTGGLWDNSECPNCCGSTTCGQDPMKFCHEPCCGPAQCVCPNDKPFWSVETGCFDAAACYP